jgi:hypothetical protein
MVTIVGVRNYIAPDLIEAMRFLGRAPNLALVRQLRHRALPLGRLDEVIADATENRAPPVLVGPGERDRRWRPFRLRPLHPRLLVRDAPSRDQSGRAVDGPTHGQDHGPAVGSRVALQRVEGRRVGILTMSFAVELWF